METSKQYLKSACLVTVAYIFCHGVTAWVVAPVQRHFLGEITIFASLVYLPHGVRVLAVWLLGWRAAVPLIFAAFVSELLFTSNDIRDMMQDVLLMSLIIGVMSVYTSFACFRATGVDVSFAPGARMSWRQLLAVGAFASILNSLGQTIVFSGFLSTREELRAIFVYFWGDLIGQVVIMFALMILFRTLRLAKHRASL